MRVQRKDKSLDQLKEEVKIEFSKMLSDLHQRTLPEQEAILHLLVDNLKATHSKNLYGMRYSEESKSRRQQIKLIIGCRRYEQVRALCTCTMN